MKLKKSTTEGTEKKRFRFIKSYVNSVVAYSQGEYYLINFSVFSVVNLSQYIA
jgi:hypothetical protein